MQPFDQAWTLLKQFANPSAGNTMSVIGGNVMYNGQPIQPDEQGNYSAPGVSITGSSIGGGGDGDKTQRAMELFAQVQAAKRDRQQQLIDAGLIPTGPAAGMQQPPPPPLPFPQVPPAPDLDQMMQQQQ